MASENDVVTSGYNVNLPTTPEAAHAEQKRVLGLMESIEQDRAALFAATDKHHADPRPLKPSVSSEQYAAQKSLIAQEVQLRTMAPTLVTDLAAAYGLIATLLEAQAEREAALERVRNAQHNIAARLKNRADNSTGNMKIGYRAAAEWILEANDIRAALATAPAEAE